MDYEEWNQGRIGGGYVKFYNPFKPHIIQNGFGYFVRVFSIFGTKHYLDEDYDWHNYCLSASLFKSFESAKYLLVSYNCFVHNKKLENKEYKKKCKERVVRG